MAEISAALVKKLRDATKAGMMDCKKALQENGGDFEKAKDWIRKQGLVKAADMSDRQTAEGRIFTYLHHNKRIGVLLEAGCETDFTAANDDFGKLFEGIALHIAASAPKYLTRDEVPAELIERERAIYLETVKGKPENMQEKIVEGQLGKFFESICLLEQKYVKDDSKTVDGAIKELAAVIGENLQVRRFVRYEIGI